MPRSPWVNLHLPTRDSQGDKDGLGLIKNADEIASAVPELDVKWLDSCLWESISQVSPRASLDRFLFTTAGRSIAKQISESKRGVRVFGAGKASSGFAEAFSDIFHPSEKCELNGLSDKSSNSYVVRKGSHPLPDENTMRNSTALLESALAVDTDDMVFFLLSGGASSIFAIPHNGIELFEKVEISRALMGGGANISELNCFRRHFSSVKGGRFAAALYPRGIITLTISDVPTGNVEDIGSGPTVPDPRTCKDALAVLGRFGLSRMLRPESRRMLQNGELESLKPGDSKLGRSQMHVIAGNSDAVNGFAEASRKRGTTAIVSEGKVSSDPEGAVKRLIEEGRRKLNGRGTLVSGGETVLSVPSNARGGRCQHTALVASEFLRENELFIAFGTDGLDGNSSLAGGIGRKSEDDVREHIASFESERYLTREGRGILTGATGTNVSDLYIYIRL